MKVQQHRSDLTRIQFLNASVAEMRLHIERGGFLPFAGLYQEMNYLSEHFEETTAQLIKANAAWVMATGAKNKMVKKLSQTVRDFMGTLERRGKRLEHPEHFLKGFRRYLEKGKYPEAKNLVAWGILAENLITAERHAQSQGYPPMSNPGAEDLEPYVAQYMDVHMEMVNKKSELSDVREELQQMRGRIDFLARQLHLYLRGWLLDKKPSRARDIIRQFGYRYYNPDKKKTTGKKKDGGSND